MNLRRRKALEKRYIKAREAGKILDPVLYGDFTPVPVSLPWGVRGSLWVAGHHTGEDHACDVGSFAVAVTWGTVVGAGWGGYPRNWGPYYGNVVVINTRSGRYTYGYCHLSHIAVKVGQRVVPGTIVGRTGDTGHTTGPHCHFEARTFNGSYGDDVNPINVKQKGH